MDNNVCFVCEMFWNAIIFVFLLLDIRIFPNLLYILLYVSSCNRWVEGLLAFQECDILHTIILIQVIYKLWMFHNFFNFFLHFLKTCCIYYKIFYFKISAQLFISNLPKHCIMKRKRFWVKLTTSLLVIFAATRPNRRT